MISNLIIDFLSDFQSLQSTLDFLCHASLLRAGDFFDQSKNGSQMSPGPLGSIFLHSFGTLSSAVTTRGFETGHQWPTEDHSSIGQVICPSTDPKTSPRQPGGGRQALREGSRQPPRALQACEAAPFQAADSSSLLSCSPLSSPATAA